MINYNVIVRALTEWTSTNTTMSMDQTSIAEGIGGYMTGFDSGALPGFVNVRQRMIQGSDYSVPSAPAAFTAGATFAEVPQSTDLPSGAPAPVAGQKAVTRRYQVNFALGLFTQDKLVSFLFSLSK